VCYGEKRPGVGSGVPPAKLACLWLDKPETSTSRHGNDFSRRVTRHTPSDIDPSKTTLMNGGAAE
jgi:hypothetical protein